MDQYTSDSDDGHYTSWKQWFLSESENGYFCDIDDEYIADRFNLTGLNDVVDNYKHALALITDQLDAYDDEDVMEQIEHSAAHLYGLIHARYIITARGMTKMKEKFQNAKFGVCPRVMCGRYPLLPMGQTDIPRLSNVKLYCPTCEDIYNPPYQMYATIDGAYFGTSFHSMVLQMFPKMVPAKPVKRHVPRVFGFRVHAIAALQRWQDQTRDKLTDRLSSSGLSPSFVDDRADLELDDDDEDDTFDFELTELQKQQLEMHRQQLFDQDRRLLAPRV